MNFTTFKISGVHSDNHGRFNVEYFVACETGGKLEPETMATLFMGMQELENPSLEECDFRRVWDDFDDMIDDRKLICSDGDVWRVVRVGSDHFRIECGIQFREVSKVGFYLSQPKNQSQRPAYGRRDLFEYLGLN